MKNVLMLIFLGLSLPVYAFNYNKCIRYLQPFGMFGGITSSTQYSSSSGACSAMASKTEEKKRFFVINYDKFQNEVAQGVGEHLYTFGLLSGCSSSEQSELNILLKKNYHLIFSPSYHEKSFRELNNYATAVCQG